MMRPMESFEARRTIIEPSIVEVFDTIGQPAVEAYGSVRLFHNTLSHFLPQILAEGLSADNATAVPRVEDVAFAKAIFEKKGDYNPATKASFSKLIEGVRDERKPGVFLYPRKHDDDLPNPGYGVPERLHILGLEMGYVASQGNGAFTIDEQNRAREIRERIKHTIWASEESHIAVVRVNPWNPDVMYARIGNVASILQQRGPEVTTMVLGLPSAPFEGIYVPGRIPPDDLEITEIQRPLPSPWDDSDVDISRSRYYYTPPVL